MKPELSMRVIYYVKYYWLEDLKIDTDGDYIDENGNKLTETKIVEEVIKTPTDLTIKRNYEIKVVHSWDKGFYEVTSKKGIIFIDQYNFKHFRTYEEFIKTFEYFVKCRD